MTLKTYAEFVRSADEQPFELFLGRWLLMPDCSSIEGFDETDLDLSSEVLKRVYDVVNRTVDEIREKANMSQSEFANRFAIPLRTLQNWEYRGGCPVYLRLLFQSALNQCDLYTMMGIK